MEILSDAVFKGNLSVDKTITVGSVSICAGGQIVAQGLDIAGKLSAPIGCSTIDICGSVKMSGSLTTDHVETNYVYLTNVNEAAGYTLSFNLKGGRSFTFDCTSPSGKIALKSDIPNTSDFALKSEVNSVKNGLLHSGTKLIDFDVPLDCTRFRVGPITDYYGYNTVSGLSVVSASMHKYIEYGDPNELDSTKSLCYTKFANFAELMPANDGYVYINKASGYSISASDKYAVSVIWRC